MLTVLEDLIFCVCMKMQNAEGRFQDFQTLDFETLRRVGAICMQCSAGVKVGVDTVRPPLSA